MIHRVVPLVVLLFPVSEVTLALRKRSRGGSAQSEDKGSMRQLWLAVALGVTLAFLALDVPRTRLTWARPVVELVALALLVGGLGLRWLAILTLGRLFTVDVAIHADHSVVQSGLYRHVRHPSYSGLLLAFLGLGTYFGNWLSILAVFVPVTLAILNRVAKEEEALLRSLGPAYAAYCAHTKRFIPGLL